MRLIENHLRIRLIPPKVSPRLTVVADCGHNDIALFLVHHGQNVLHTKFDKHPPKTHRETRAHHTLRNSQWYQEPGTDVYDLRVALCEATATLAVRSA